MAPRTPPSGQLDIPLVWETEPGAETKETAPAPGNAPAASAPVAGAVRLWVAALVDAGITAVGAAALVALAALLVESIAPGQLVLAAAAGVEAVAVVALGCLWGWRATPGMLVLGVCFSEPIPFGRVCRLWLVWLPSLVLAGIPLVVRRRGESAAERLAGGVLRFRSLPASV